MIVFIGQTLYDNSGGRSVLPGDIQITTEILLQGALLFAILDAVYVPLLARHVSAGLYRQVKWVLVVVAAIVWFGIWGWATGYYWETVYVYVFPIYVLLACHPELICARALGLSVPTKE